MRYRNFLVTLLSLMVMTVGAQYRVNIGVATNGSITTATPTVASGTTVTLNVTPVEGYYITASDIEVIPTGNVAQVRNRAPGINVAVLAVKGGITPEGKGTFTFTMPSSNVSITATFHSRTDISADCTVTLDQSSFAYDGAAHQTVLATGGLVYNSTALIGTDGDAGTTNGMREYDATPIYPSADYINAGTKAVSYTLRGKYKGTATGNFTITKNAITVKAMDQGIEYGGSITNTKDYIVITAGSLVSGHSITGVSIVNTAVAGTTTGTHSKVYPANDTYADVLQISSGSVVIKNAASTDVSSNYDVTLQTGDLTIASFSLANAEVEVLENTFDYDGNKHDATIKVYHGKTETAPETYTYTGFISPDQYDVYYYNDSYTESTTAPTNAGTYTIKLKAKAGADVAGVKDNVGILKINTIVMTATADDVVKFYTDDVPELTATYSGHIDADEAYLNRGVLTTTATKTSPLGTYDIDFTTAPSFSTGNYTVETEKGTLTITKLPMDFATAVISNNEKNYTGSAQAPTVMIQNNGITIPADGNYTLIYKDGEGAEVNPVEVGSYTVIARSIDAGNLSGEKEVGVMTISPKPVSSTSDITIEAGSPTYDGTALTPTSLVVKDGGQIVPASNYTATYSNNVNAGNKARVTLTMSGSYSGTVTGNFTINPKPVTVTAKAQTILYGETIQTGNGTATATGLVSGHTLKSASVSTTETEVGSYPSGIAVADAWIVAGETDMTDNYAISYQPGLLKIVAHNTNPNISVGAIADQTYSGTAKTPAVTVKDGNNVLRAGTDYDVTYENNIDAGTAKAIITIGSSGALVETFKINPKAATVTAMNQTITYGEAVSSTPADVTVTGLISGHSLTAITLTPASTDVGTVALTPSVAAVSSGGADVSGNYDFTYVNGTVTINKKKYSDHPDDFTVENISNVVYNGQAQKPVPVVKDTESTLVQVLEEGKDYTLTYSDNTNAGTATITIALQGNYEGSFTKNFDILKRSAYLKLQDQTIIQGGSPLSTVNYAELTNQVQGHKLGSVTLVFNNNNTSSTDFTTVAAGEWPGQLGFSAATVVDGTETDVTANYNLEHVDGTLTVLGKADESFTIAIDGDNTFEYTGTALMPGVIVKKDGTTVLTKGTDYTLQYQGNIEAGTGRVIAQLQGDYSGALMKEFTITQRSISVKAQDQTIVYGTTISDEPSKALALTTDNQQLENVTIHHLGSVMLTVAEDATNVGTHTGAIVPSNASIVDNSGADVTKNFIITGYTAGNLTITAKPYSATSGYIVELEEGSYPYKAAAYEPEVTVKDGSKTLTKGTDYNLTYQNNVNAGTATVTVNFKGNYQGSTSQTFTITKRRATITPNEQTIYYHNGGINSTTSDVTVDGLLDGQTLRSVTLTTNETEVGAYPSGITITGATVASGATDVSANYELVYGIGKLTIEEKPYSENGDFVISPIADQSYTGSPLTPALVIKDQNILLTEGTDYEVSYKDNVNVGTATATINFTGSYTGSTSVTFKIVPINLTVTAVDQTIIFGGSINTEPNWATLSGQADGDVLSSVTIATDVTSIGTHVDAITVSDAKIMCGETDVTSNYVISYAAGILTVLKETDENLTVTPIADCPYTGQPVEPEVTVTAGSKTLVAGTDFDVTYENNINTGTAKALIIFKGNYSGALTESFNIIKARLTVTAKDQKIVEGATVVSEPSYVVTEGLLAGHTLSAITLTPSITTEGTGTLTPSEAAVSDGNGDVTANYDITYQAGNVTILPKAGKNLTATLDETEFNYTGNPIRPNVTVKDGTTVLTAGSAYDVEYQNNVNAGTASVVIAMKGGYSGSLTKTFNINKLDLTVTAKEQKIIYGESIASEPGYVTTTGLATGHKLTAITLIPSITGAGEGTLTPSGAVISDDNVDVTANYNITYNSGKFTVLNKASENLTATLDETEIVYTGRSITPNVTVKDGNTVLTAGKDYDVTYENNVNVGTAKALITFKGSYNGAETLTFQITTAQLTVTAVDQTIIFGESINTEPNWATLSGQMTGHTVGRATIATNVSSVGTHVDAITVSNAKILSGETDVTSNYVISYVAGTLTVLEKADENLSVAPIADCPYTGKPVEPEVTVSDGTKTLVAGTDYDVTYENNINTGIAKALIILKGDYSGALSETFNIVKYKLTVTAKDQKIVEGATVVNEPSYVITEGLLAGHTLKAITLTPSITEVGTGTLTPSEAAVSDGVSDMTVNYEITYQAGNITILEKASENLTATLNETKFTYTGSPITPSLTVKNGTAVLTAGTDYDVEYQNNVNAGTASAIITMKGNYSGALSKTFTIIKPMLAVTAQDQNIIYGESVASEPDDVITEGLVSGHTLTAITLTPSITGAGEGTLTPSGAAISDGTADVTANYDITYTAGTLTVEKKSIANMTATITPNSIVCGEDAPTLTVMDGQYMLVENKDFTLLQWQDSEGKAVEITSAKPGVYTAVVEGKDNYTGTLVVNSLTVGTQNIQGATFTFTPSSATFKEDASHTAIDQTPAFTVTKGDNELTEGTHYNAKWQKYDSGSWVDLSATETVAMAGTYRVVITGIGDFASQTTSQSFEVAQYTLTDANVTVAEAGVSTLTYDGTEHQPVLVVKVTHDATEVTLRKDIDYVITAPEGYDAADTYKAAGAYTFTITGAGNYAGGGSATFTIDPQNYDLAFSGTGKWATFYNDEQVRLKRGDIASGLTAYVVTGVSATSVTAEEISGDVIPAKMPVLLNRGTSTATSFACEIIGDDMMNMTPSISNFVGVGTDTSISRGNYILVGDVFVRSNAGTLPANRCYLTILGSSGARSIVVDNGAGTTAIETMESESESDDAEQWYSLDGHRIDKPVQKGIYIKNNKKVVIK